MSVAAVPPALVRVVVKAFVVDTAMVPKFRVVGDVVSEAGSTAEPDMDSVTGEEPPEMTTLLVTEPPPVGA